MGGGPGWLENVAPAPFVVEAGQDPERRLPVVGDGRLGWRGGELGGRGRRGRRQARPDLRIGAAGRGSRSGRSGIGFICLDIIVALGVLKLGFRKTCQRSATREMRSQVAKADLGATSEWFIC